MSDKLFHEVVAEMGPTIDDKWLEVHVQKLEALPVYAAFSWGWTFLMASPEFRVSHLYRAQAALDNKPFGCEMCEEKPATKYHCYIGRVCDECYATLPQE